MRKTVVVLFVALVTLMSFSAVQAQVPKEGTIAGRIVWTGTVKTLPGPDKSTSVYSNELTGVYIADSPGDILENASLHSIGYGGTVNGVYNDQALFSLTRPDGDKIFVRFTGTRGPDGIRRTAMIVGGTGKFGGISGEGTGIPGKPVKPAMEGVSAGIGNWNFSYKLP